MALKYLLLYMATSVFLDDVGGKMDGWRRVTHLILFYINVLLQKVGAAYNKSTILYLK